MLEGFKEGSRELRRHRRQITKICVSYCPRTRHGIATQPPPHPSAPREKCRARAFAAGALCHPLGQVARQGERFQSARAGGHGSAATKISSRETGWGSRAGTIAAASKRCAPPPFQRSRMVSRRAGSGIQRVRVCAVAAPLHRTPRRLWVIDEFTAGNFGGVGATRCGFGVRWRQKAIPWASRAFAPRRLRASDLLPNNVIRRGVSHGRIEVGASRWGRKALGGGGGLGITSRVRTQTVVRRRFQRRAWPARR